MSISELTLHYLPEKTLHLLPEKTFYLEKTLHLLPEKTLYLLPEKTLHLLPEKTLHIGMRRLISRWREWLRNNSKLHSNNDRCGAEGGRNELPPAGDKWLL